MKKAVITELEQAVKEKFVEGTHREEISRSPEMEEQKRPPYNGWLISDSFWKRSLAVYGYSIVGSIVGSILFFAAMLTAYFLVLLIFAALVNVSS